MLSLNPRWWGVVLVVLILCGLVAYGEERGFSVRGLMTATDQEAQEGYFAVGRELTIVTKPGSQIHDDLKAMAGAEVTVVVTTR